MLPKPVAEWDNASWSIHAAEQTFLWVISFIATMSDCCRTPEVIIPEVLAPPVGRLSTIITITTAAYDRRYA